MGGYQHDDLDVYGGPVEQSVMYEIENLWPSIGMDDTIDRAHRDGTLSGQVCG